MPTYIKTCEGCGVTFYAHRSNKRYHSDACRSQQYTAANLEKVRKQKRDAARQRRAADPQRAREADRRNRQKHPDRAREAQRRWREAHQKEVRDYRQRYDAANAEQKREARRRWRQENPQEAKEVDRRQRESLRERIARGEKERPVQKPGRSMRFIHGKDWEMAFSEFWEAQSARCYLCGDPLEPDKPHAVVIDHDHDCCPQRRSCEICRRGLACGRCNKLVGLANEDPARLRRIADALEAAHILVQERMRARGNAL